MEGMQQIGRLAMRAEGSLWNAYYAMTDTMDEALFLGSIRLAAISDNPTRKQAFMDMMRDMVSEILTGIAGTAPAWAGPVEAPESERGGTS